jgi:hypothetical protein
MQIKNIFYSPVPLLLLTLVSALPQTARADYYKYTDSAGSVCITNKRDAVPPKYRATMKVIREETLAAKDKATRLETPRKAQPAPATSVSPPDKAVVAAEEPTTAFGRLASRFPWFKPALFVGAVILLFLIVRKLAAALPSALLARLVCIVFFLGVFVAIYVCYAKYLTDNCIAFKRKMLTMFEKANRREAPEPGERPLPMPDRSMADR